MRTPSRPLLTFAALSAGLVAAAATLLPLGALALRDPVPDRSACLPADLTLAPTRDAPPPGAVMGRLLVANQFAGTASLVDLATGRVVHLDVGDEPHDAVVSPDGRWGVVSDFGPKRRGRFMGSRLFVIDMARGRVARTVRTGEHRGLHDVAFRPGHPTRVLVTAQTSRSVLEVDVVTGAIVGAMDTRGERSHVLAATADGRTVFTANESTATVSRMDVGAHAFVATFPATPHVEGIAVTADGRELWVGEQALGAVTVRDAATGATLATLRGFVYPHRIVRAPDGRIVISDPGCRTIVVADPATRRVVRTLRAPQDPPVLVGDVAPDGRVAFASVSDDRAVIALDLESGAILARHRAGWAADGLGWGPKE